MGADSEGGGASTPQGGALASGGNESDNGGADRGGGDSEPGGDAGQGGGSEPISEVCGDAIRDPLLEECDDGPGSDEDSCTAACAVSSYPVVPRELGRRAKSRHLGFGRHSIASGERGSGVVFVETSDSFSKLWLSRFDRYGRRLGAPVDAGAEAYPGDEADPVLAALPGGAWAVAFGDSSQGSLDIALRRFDPEGERTTTRLANPTTPGAQYAPDVIWAGGVLHVIWTDNLSVKTRDFSDELDPLSEEILLFNDAIPGSATLAEHAFGVAMAARIQDGSAERIEVVAGDVKWSVGPFIPGASLERPALVSVNEDILVLAFTEGTDPLDTGVANVSRLSLAVLDARAPGTVAPSGGPSRADLGGDVALAQRRPALIRTSSRFYLAWENDSLVGDASSQELRLQEFSWDADAAALTWQQELPFSVDASSLGSQRAPAIAATPLSPQGAIATVWEEVMAEGASAPDLMFSLRPSPFIF